LALPWGRLPANAHRMGQKCGVPIVAPPCKPPRLPRLGECVCRHGDARWMRGDIDEQEDVVHHFLESTTGNHSSWTKDDSWRSDVTKEVENMPVPQGGVYTGQAREDGQPHGTGTQRWPDGTMYNGSWVRGAAHGQGKLTKSDGSGYEGMWVEGRKHGVGYERLVDQSEYRGNFADGQKHGHGAFKWKGGASYTGEFVEDILQGEGLFLWGDSRSYRGQWVQSHMHGQGRFEWSDGKCFEGKYENDKKHGPGVFMWPDGSKCVGVWQNGKQHGIGTHINAAGVARKGRWKAGNLDQWLEPLPEKSERQEPKTTTDEANGSGEANEIPANGAPAARTDSRARSGSIVSNEEI